MSPDGRWRWDGSTWVPTRAAGHAWVRPSWLRLDLEGHAVPATVAAIVGVAVLGDQAWRTGAFGLGSALALAAAAAGLLTSGWIRTRESRLLAAASLVFAVALAVRSSPWLTWLDLVASAGLLLMAASLGRAGSLFDLPFAQAGARIAHGMLHLLAGAAFVARAPALDLRRAPHLGSVVRGLTIAVPIGAVLCALLASADAVFASFFRFQFDAAQVALDLIFLTVCGLAAAGLLRYAAARPMTAAGLRWRLGIHESLVVLLVLDAVLFGFAVAQAVAVTGAGAQALREAGMTYADYARSGFFQLLWVAGITLAVLVLFTRITRESGPRGRRLSRALALVAAALTLLVVYVSFRRLSLYEEAYGFTMLRLYSHVFAVWVGVVFMLFAAGLAGIHRRRDWFLGAAGLSALALLAAMNLLNPEALVVTQNLQRAAATHRLDADYLATLSTDAAPALAQSGDSRARHAACSIRPAGSGWAAWNLSGAQADSAHC